jgi:hypothetical protein
MYKKEKKQPLNYRTASDACSKNVKTKIRMHIYNAFIIDCIVYIPSVRISE